MIKVAADKYLLDIADFLPQKEIDLTLYDPEQPLHPLPDDTQALLIRSVTKINPQSLPALPAALEFVGTGSAGIDHVDTSYLAEHHIAFANAAGCNARSVAEYVATAVLLWGDQKKIDITDCALGIVGVGHVGQEVQKQMQALGMTTVLYDPPREQREPGFQSATQEEVLQSDILTLHCPLTHKGAHPTYHWLDDDTIKNHSFKLVINTARGGVVNEKALLRAHKNGPIEDYILDVWEGEPCFNNETAQHAFIKTPHIAGYSLQAKTRASAMISDALFQHFSLPTPNYNSIIQPQAVSLSSTTSSLSTILTQLHPIKCYEQKFTALINLPLKQKAAKFRKIRAYHPLRDEFKALNIPPDLKNGHPLLKKLFFNEF